MGTAGPQKPTLAVANTEIRTYYFTSPTFARPFIMDSVVYLLGSLEFLILELEAK